MKATTHFDLLTSPLRGRNLLEASAGTGKTFTIAGLFLRLLVEKGLNVDQILVVTFTEAATEELRDRIRQRLSLALVALDSGASEDSFLAGWLHQWGGDLTRRRVAQALADFDQAAIYTIHGFCQKVLQDFAFECGQPFDSELIVSQKELLAEVVADFWRTRVYNLSTSFMRFLQTRQTNVESLMKFATTWLRQHDAEVIPPVVSPDLILCEEELMQAFQAVADVWQKSRNEVIELLCSSPHLNRNSYAVAKIPVWAKNFDAYIAAGQAYPGFAELKRFSQQEIATRTKKSGIPPQHPLFTACDRLVECLDQLESVYDQQLLTLEHDFLETLPQNLAARKQSLNVRYFDDLLLDMRTAIRAEDGGRLIESLREQFPAALVDEFQDTDPIQYEIFRSVYAHSGCTLFFIGDPKQSIYQFRGADIYSYLGAMNDVDAIYTLGTNWRSCGPLVDALNAFWMGIDNPFLFPEIPYHPVEFDPNKRVSQLRYDNVPDKQPLHLWFFPTEDEQRLSKEAAESQVCEAFCNEIVRLLQKGQTGNLSVEERPLAAGDIAVLVRTNNQARLFQERLRQRQVPAVLFGMDSLFAAVEMADLYKILRAIAAPQDVRLVRAALATDLLGWDCRGLFDSLNEDRNWQETLERFQQYQHIWQQRGLMTMSGIFLAQERIRERLLGLVNGERRLTNLLHGLEVLQQARVEGQLSIDGLLQWLQRQLNDQPDQEEYQLRLESDQTAVKIVTIHKSKGLEYPVVFCPYCWGGTNHLGRKSGNKPDSRRVLFHRPESRQVVFDIGSSDIEDHRTLAAWEELAENLRLFYVAVTRAKYRCYVAWGAFKGGDSSALAYCLYSADVREQAPMLPALAQHVGGLNSDELFERCASLATSGGGITVKQVAFEEPEIFYPTAQTLDLRGPRAFSGTIPRASKITSFTGLVADTGIPDLPGWEPERRLAEEHVASSGSESFLDFPRGAKPGTCLHQILESIDFSNPGRLQPVIQTQLRQFGISDQWAEVLEPFLKKLFDFQLLADPEFRLCDLKHGEWLTEMEFHLPVQNVSGRRLQQVFAAHGSASLSTETLNALGGLADDSLSRYLKGFIDLIFVYQGRYYLLDWKSNHLGREAENYTSSALNEVIGQEFYFLQYHIYLLALHRYLQQRLPDYDYERHIGGVLYVFLRGFAVTPYLSGLGIHAARPSQATISALDDAICRAGRGEA